MWIIRVVSLGYNRLLNSWKFCLQLLQPQHYTMSSGSSGHHIFMKVVKNLCCKPRGKHKPIFSTIKQNCAVAIMVSLGQKYKDIDTNQQFNTYVVNKTSRLKIWTDY
jgi:hypothetical protein